MQSGTLPVAAAGETVTAHIVFDNPDNREDWLVSAKTPFAGSVRLVGRDDEGIAVPSRGQLVLTPGGGPHLIFENLTTDLDNGMEAVVTVEFFGIGHKLFTLQVTAETPLAIPRVSQ